MKQQNKRRIPYKVLMQLFDQLPVSAFYITGVGGLPTTITGMTGKIIDSDLPDVATQVANNRVFADFNPNPKGTTPKLSVAIGEAVKLHRLKVVDDPIRLPPLVPVDEMPAEDVVRINYQKFMHLLSNTPDANRIFENAVTELPGFQTDQELRASQQVSTVSYYPKYQLGKTDRALASWFNAIVESFKDGKLEELAEEVSHEFEFLKDVVTRHYLGNGSIEGQIGRWNAVEAVYENVKNDREHKRVSDMSQSDMFTLLQKRFPLNVVEAEITGFTDLYNLFVDPVFVSTKLGRVQAPGLSVNYSADSGINLGRASEVVDREHSLPYDFAYARAVGKYLSQVHNSHEDFLREHPDSRLVKLKPKEEVYLRDDYKKKTRSIFVYNAGIQMFAGMLLKPTHFKLRNAIEDPEVWSGIGFSPFHGGLHKFITAVRERPNFVFVYADNYYGNFKNEAGDIIYTSMDGSKHEATVTPSDVEVELVRSALHFSPDGVVNLMTKIPVETENYIKVMGVVNTRPIAVFGMAHLPAHNLGSGAQGTAYFNTVRTMRFADKINSYNARGSKMFYNDARKDVEYHELDAALKQLIKADDLSNINTVTGVRFGLESGFYVKHLDKYAETGRVLPLDLLGFDAVNLTTFGLGDTWVPVLNKTRLFRSLAFIKVRNKFKHRDPDRKFANSFMTIMKLRALYLLGGWIYPGLAGTITVYINSLMEAMGFEMRNPWDTTDVRSMVEDVAGEEFDMDEALMDTIIAAVSQIAVPSLHEVLSLLLPKSEVEAMTQKLLSQDDWYRYFPAEAWSKYMSADPKLTVPQEYINFGFNKHSAIAREVTRGEIEIPSKPVPLTFTEMNPDTMKHSVIPAQPPRVKASPLGPEESVSTVRQTFGPKTAVAKSTYTSMMKALKRREERVIADLREGPPLAVVFGADWADWMAGQLIKGTLRLKTFPEKRIATFFSDLRKQGLVVPRKTDTFEHDLKIFITILTDANYFSLLARIDDYMNVVNFGGDKAALAAFNRSFDLYWEYLNKIKDPVVHEKAQPKLLFEKNITNRSEPLASKASFVFMHEPEDAKAIQIREVLLAVLFGGVGVESKPAPPEVNRMGTRK